MRVLAVGSGGVGTSAALIAQRREFFELWVCADYDLSRSQALADRVGDPRFVAARIDAANTHEITAICRQHGITHVLNVIDPRYVMPIFDGAFAAGANYLDTAMSNLRKQVNGRALTCWHYVGWELSRGYLMFLPGMRQITYLVRLMKSVFAMAPI